MCDRKHLKPTREAVSLFHGFLSIGYDIARAMYYRLEREDRWREIHIEEVRRSLAHFDPDRLLSETDITLSMQKALSVLLRADSPLPGVEIARQAGISTESFR
jgi:hypothetical protein